MKGTIIQTFIYLILGLTCIIVGGELTVSITPAEIWHDALLVIGGILMGGFCAMLVVLNIKLKESHKALRGKG